MQFASGKAIKPDVAKSNRNITKSSTAEYFAKNLQQVGFSSFTKAVLTSVKESIDNSLDACEDARILPEIHVEIQKMGAGSAKNADLIRIRVEDNGPGINPDDVIKVFGEYLASSKFGRGRCSRGQQGIGISAVTTWAQLTHGSGVTVISKTKKMNKAIKCDIEVDIKKNIGNLKKKENFDWGDKAHGISCEFIMDGRVQLNGDSGLLTYLQGTALVNPHLKLSYKLLDNELVTVERITTEIPEIPEATEPHPHTMKLGEFIAHSHLFGKTNTQKWLTTSFSRISTKVIEDLIKAKVPKSLFKKALSTLTEADLRLLYKQLQEAKLMAPTTKSVLSIGETDLAKSIQRLGEVDFFSVVSRKPTICDFKPVLFEVAIARKSKPADNEKDSPVQILRFANRVPLQFDKGACAIVKAIESVNWKAYGLNQPKKSLPQGPYVFAVSLVSPFIKFKNASKETVDASEELVDELRKALIQCGQRLGAHIKREAKAADMERKLQHIESFAPILVKGLVRILEAPQKRETKALEGLAKILGRDTKEIAKDVEEAEKKAAKISLEMAEKGIKRLSKDKVIDKRKKTTKKETSQSDLF